jgi:hypothetical protein
MHQTQLRELDLSNSINIKCSHTTGGLTCAQDVIDQKLMSVFTDLTIVDSALGKLHKILDSRNMERRLDYGRFSLDYI